MMRAKDAGSSLKANILKAAVDARKSLTDLVANRPDVVNAKLKEKIEEQIDIAELKQEEEAKQETSVPLPDVGEIKAQGFMTSYDERKDQYQTRYLPVHSSDPESGVYAEQRVMQDLMRATQTNMVVILSAHEPVDARKQAIRDFAFTHSGMKVYVCYIHGALGAGDNRLIDVTKGGWRIVKNFR
jgi:hypothetical protein